MLFSRTEIASYINTHFEPVWQNLRPAPIVHINFGNGTELTRTLHGNIATSVLDVEGNVLDVLPGIYEPSAYLHQLTQLCLLHKYIAQESCRQREQTSKDYHIMHAIALKNDTALPFLNDTGFFSKSRIEKPIKLLVMGTDANASRLRAKPSSIPENGTESLAGWKSLVEDTQVNEKVRRLAIHELLAKTGFVTPDNIIRQIYKDILHTDLDDPYLGLSETLFKSYPFTREDQQR